jgi:ribosomal protein S18 acetylase RimI-like enzyme
MSVTSVFARSATSAELGLHQVFTLKSKNEASAYRGHMDFRPPPVSSETIVVVGGAGESVFGFLSAYDAGAGRWFIDVLHVEAPAREVGIGNAMVQCVVQLLKDRGAKSVNAAALPGDRSTKNLFERHGLVAQMITVGKNL